MSNLIDFIICEEIDCFYMIDNQIYSKIKDFNNESKIIEIPYEYFNLIKNNIPLITEYQKLYYLFQYLNEAQIKYKDIIKQSAKDMTSLKNILDMSTFSTDLQKKMITPTPFSIGWSLIDKFGSLLLDNYKKSKDNIEKRNIEKCIKLFSGIKKRIKNDKYISPQTVSILEKALKSWNTYQAKNICNRDINKSRIGIILKKSANTLNFLSKFDPTSIILPSSYAIKLGLSGVQNLKQKELVKSKSFNDVQNSSYKIKKANELLRKAKEKIQQQKKK